MPIDSKEIILGGTFKQALKEALNDKEFKEEIKQILNENNQS